MGVLDDEGVEDEVGKRAAGSMVAAEGSEKQGRRESMRADEIEVSLPLGPAAPESHEGPKSISTVDRSIEEKSGSTGPPTSWTVSTAAGGRDSSGTSDSPAPFSAVLAVVEALVVEGEAVFLCFLRSPERSVPEALQGYTVCGMQ